MTDEQQLWEDIAGEYDEGRNTAKAVPASQLSHAAEEARRFAAQDKEYGVGRAYWLGHARELRARINEAVLAVRKDRVPLTRRERYVLQAEKAAREIEQWPAWMRLSAVPPTIPPWPTDRLGCPPCFTPSAAQPPNERSTDTTGHHEPPAHEPG